VHGKTVFAVANFHNSYA